MSVANKIVDDTRTKRGEMFKAFDRYFQSRRSLLNTGLTQDEFRARVDENASLFAAAEQAALAFGESIRRYERYLDNVPLSELDESSASRAAAGPNSSD